MIAIASNGHLVRYEKTLLDIETRKNSLLDTDTTTNAKVLRDESDLVTWFDLNTKSPWTDKV